MSVINNPQDARLFFERAHREGFAYPAFNVVNMEGVNAVRLSVERSKAKGVIIQFSTGAGKHASGPALKNATLGALSLADHTRRVFADCQTPVFVHTDHCMWKDIQFIEDLLAKEDSGFTGNMFDGSDANMETNLARCLKLIPRYGESGRIPEFEFVPTGGEEDGAVSGESHELYSEPEDFVTVHERLGSPLRDAGIFALYAFGFGNTHGIHKAGNVRLRPEILEQGQAALAARFPGQRHFLVFHGGSGSEDQEFAAAIAAGVVKINIDTETQYRWTEGYLDFVDQHGSQMRNRTKGKKRYDPRSGLLAAIEKMAQEQEALLHKFGAAGDSA